MQARRSTPLAVATLAAFALGACGSGGAAERIAADACGIMGQVAEEGFAAFDEELFEDLQGLQDRADEAGLSDEAMEAAIRDECPDVLDMLDELDL